MDFSPNTCLTHGVAGDLLETRDLRLVRAIVEAGGVTRAAKRLHVSQSAVSHQLRGLETRLGQPLFKRDRQQLSLTAAGQRLLEVSHQVLGPLAQCELELKRALVKERPKLRVATQCYTAYHWLPKALVALNADHPEVDLALASEAIGDAAEALDKDTTDLVLCVSPPTRRGLVHASLFKDELVLAVPRGHPLGHKAFVEGSDLADQTLIQSSVSSRERDLVLKKLFGQAPPRVARVLRVPVAEAVMDLVQAGLGVSILAGFTLASRLTRGDVQAVRLTKRGLPRQWTAVYRRGSALSGPIGTLLDTLKRCYPELLRTRR
jgi:LysR family transcriptional regulator for metE and metH